MRRATVSWEVVTRRCVLKAAMRDTKDVGILKDFCETVTGPKAHPDVVE